MSPRSGFRSGGTCERTLVPVFVPGGTSECTVVPVFVPGEHPPKAPFWKTTLLSAPDKSNHLPLHVSLLSCPDPPDNICGLNLSPGLEMGNFAKKSSERASCLRKSLDVKVLRA